MSSYLSTPMLAATVRTEEDLPSFPLLATPKVDGVRALIVGGRLVSRSLKLIPNTRIRAMLESLLPEGADGEVYCGDLYSTTSTVMSSDADGAFRFFWFDWVYDVGVPYSVRVSSIMGYVAVHETDPQLVVPLVPHTVNSIDELRCYEEHVVESGLEGLILRVPKGRYKSGRSTLKEGLMLKLKRYLDSEAIIVGTEELVRNTGLAGCTLGSIVAQGPDGVVFRIGTGYTANQRLALWKDRDVIVGKLVKYRHMGHGEKDRPRGPVFLGLRHQDDV
jgi:DNA ligase 1